jgi:hypothetical protein
MKRRKRQANGTGTKIKTLPSGLLRKDISLGTKNDGKRNRRAVYGKTPEEIAKKVLELQYRHGFNLDSETSALTFGAMLDLWLYSRREYLEESSLERYEQYLKSYVPKRLKDMPLQDIRASHLTALDAIKDLPTHSGNVPRGSHSGLYPGEPSNLYPSPSDPGRH